ncbi:MAG: hypothetical protein R2777_08615 [Chitinophagales bacterium]
MYLGRGYNFPVALEGALKLKEIFIYMLRVTQQRDETCISIALIDENLPVVVLATKNSQYDKKCE